MRTLVLLFLFTASILPVFSQYAEGDSVKLLKVSNVRKNKYILIEEGEYVSYKTIGQSTKRARKGQLRNISENDTLIIGTKKVSLNSISMLMSRTHKSAIKSKNIGIAVAGGLLLGAGAGLLTVNKRNATILGVTGVVAGFSVLVSAIIPLTHSNHYTIEKGWRFEIIKMVLPDEDFIYQHY